MFEVDLPKDGEASFRKFLGEVLESSGEIKITKETGLFEYFAKTNFARFSQESIGNSRKPLGRFPKH